MTETDRTTMQAYLDRPLDELMDELMVADGSRGPTWDRILEPVRERLCVEWDWCRVRQDARFDDRFALAMAVASVLSQPVLHLPFTADVALVAAIAVKMGLDRLCGCGE